MNDKTRKLIERATVHLPDKEGLGVICTGGYILTAAHCIEINLDGGMTLGDFSLQRVIAGKVEIEAEILAVELISDLALLGAPDGQNYPKAASVFGEYIDEAAGLSIFRGIAEIETQFPVHVFTHEGTWLSGTAEPYPFRGRVSMELNEAIEPGTSGGAIVNEHGDLVAIVSQTGNAADMPQYAIAPCPRLCLPSWAISELDYFADAANPQDSSESRSD